MAKKKKNTHLIPTYQKALKMAGIDVTGKESYTKLRNAWKKVRNDYFTKTGERLPSVYQYAKEYKQQQEQQEKPIPTINFGQEYIESFINRLTEIRERTFAYIENNKEGTHESGKLASIASYKFDRIERAYYNILDEIKAYLDSGVPADVLAQAIANNVELDYSIAVTLLPPSDVEVQFETTLEQMRAIWTQINESMAQQLEDEYYGV